MSIVFERKPSSPIVQPFFSRIAFAPSISCGVTGGSSRFGISPGGRGEAIGVPNPKRASCTIPSRSIAFSIAVFTPVWLSTSALF